jgi:hypothetical protein
MYQYQETPWVFTKCGHVTSESGDRTASFDKDGNQVPDGRGDGGGGVVVVVVVVVVMYGGGLLWW